MTDSLTVETDWSPVASMKDSKDVHKETGKEAYNMHSLANSVIKYGPSGFRGIVQSRNVFLCSLFAALGGFLFGYDQGVISVILVMKSFTTTFPELARGEGFYTGFMTAMLQLGAFIGAFLSGYSADRYSRRYTISMAAMVFIFGSAIQVGAVRYWMLAVGRLVGGMGVGCLSAIAPLYMSEISSPEIRGSLLALEEWNIVFGIVSAYWITFGTRFINSEWSWRFPFLLQILPAAVLGIGILFLPQSPRWLSMQERDDESLKTLCHLRRVDENDPRVRREWMEIRAETTFNRQFTRENYPECFENGKTKSFRLYVKSHRDLFKQNSLRRTLIASGLFFFQQFIGINALIYYAPQLLEKLGLSYENRLLMSGIVNVMQLVGVTPTIILLDRLGRRPLLLFGSASSLATLLCVSVLVGVYHKNWPENPAAAKGGVALIFLYMFFFGLSWGPIPWAMPSEIFNSAVRAKGVAFSTTMDWLFNFIIGLIVPIMSSRTADEVIFIFFSAFAFLSFLFIYFFVPETRHRTLEEMDAVFHDKASQNDERQKVEILRKLMADSHIRLDSANNSFGATKPDENFITAEKMS